MNTRPAQRAGPGIMVTTAAMAVLGATVGLGVAFAGGGVAAAGVGLCAVVVIATFVARRIAARPGYLGIEVPAVLVLVSTLVWRLRDTTSLASQPLDAAGLVRLATLGLGGLLAFIAVTRGDVKSVLSRLRDARALWIYVAYLGVVILGVIPSSFPLLTVFRAVNLAIGLLVILGAYQIAGDEGLWRLEKVLFWFMITHLAAVWFWVFVSPNQALRHTSSPFPYRIEGLFPAMSTDRIGEYGVILFFWGIASWMSGKDRVITSRRRSLAVSGFGSVSLLFAQYRTGYVAMAAGFLILLILHRKWIVTAGLVGFGVGTLLFGKTIAAWLPASAITSFLLRGQSLSLASKLSGRDTLWSAALPVWKHSPIIGNGLETASRFDVLSNLGRGFTSTLHSTWIEALVGTGVAGTVLLLGCLIVVSRRAFLTAMRGGRAVPVLVVGVLAVRSITGTSFEAFSLEFMLFLTMAMAVRHRPPRRAQPVAREDPGGVVRASPVGVTVAASDPQEGAHAVGQGDESG